MEVLGDAKQKSVFAGLRLVDFTWQIRPDTTIKRGTFSGNANARGVTFMRYLASAINAKVVASIDDHLATPNGWSLSKSGIFNPATVLPNGTIQTQAFHPMTAD